MHKRTTPKIFARAKQNHRNLTPAEARLWSRLRAHQLQEVHLRNQHAIGNYIVPGFYVAKSVKLWNLDNTPTLRVKTGILSQHFMKLEPK